MVGCWNLICDSVLLENSLKSIITKVCPSVTNKCFWCTKPGKYLRPNKIKKFFWIISSGGFRLHPLGHIVHCKQNIRKRRWKCSHEFYTPNIIYLTNKNWGNGNLVPWSERSKFLTPLTTSTKGIWVTKNIRPIETTIEEFSYNPLRTKMSSPCFGVTKIQNGLYLMLLHTPSNHLIRTVFPKIGFVPNVPLHFFLYLFLFHLVDSGGNWLVTM